MVVGTPVTGDLEIFRHLNAVGWTAYPHEADRAPAEYSVLLHNCPLPPGRSASPSTDVACG